MYKSLRVPLNAQIEVTTDCTQACSHCYNFWRVESPTSYQPQAHLDGVGVRGIVKKLAEAELFEVTFTGGEPLLNIEAIRAGLDECRNARLRVSMNSNLVLASRTLLSEMQDLGLGHILTTLLGPTAEIHDRIAGRNGVFVRVLENIRLAREMGIKVTANMVVSRLNADHVLPTADLARELGVTAFAATKAGHPGGCVDFKSIEIDALGLERILSDLSEAKRRLGMRIDVMEPVPTCAMWRVPIESEYVRRKCAAGVTTFTVAADGDVRPCSHLEVRCGNIFGESVTTIWERMKPWRNGSLLPDLCRSCGLLANCGGGCRMEAKMRTGSFQALDPYSAPTHAAKVAPRVVHARKLAQTGLPVFSRFEVAMDVRWRPEDFGVILFSPRGTYFFLSQAGWEVFSQFQTNIRYEIGDPRVNWGTIEPQKFLPVLARAGMLQVS